jgi:threonine/homoserine/homoserine lactone efflux protein
MLPFHAYLIYCGLYAIAIAVPGPGVIAIVARALGSGFRATIPAALGTAVGDWALMTLSAFGLALVAKAMGPLFLIVKFAGAAYLMYLGYRYWTAKVSELPDVVPASARQSFLSQ